MNVAFVGLGTMGRHMARNIREAGHALTVYNRTPGRATTLEQAGARVVASPRDGAAGAEVICLSVSTPDVVRAIVLGEDGVLAGAAPGATIIDFSTIDPATSRELAELCANQDIAFLDAPVSGGPEGAEAGSLTVMVGGPLDAFERVRPVLDAVGGRIIHTGPSGSGSTVKLINQMLVGVNLAAVLEAFMAAKLAGVDLELLFDVLRTSAGSSTMLTRSVPDYLLKRNFEPGFAVDLLAKDLDLVLQMGKALHAPLFTPAVAWQIYQAAQAAGLGGQDMTAAVIPMERLHGAAVEAGS